MILKNTSFTKAALLFLSFFISSETALADTVQLPQTGQTTSYYPGDDANIPSGVPWPNPRFSSGGTGCRTDNLTGLTWAQNGNLPGGQVTWEQALAYIVTLNGTGLCSHTDWRLPNVNELATLTNVSQANVAAWLNAAGQGFNSVQAATYWTSTTDADNGLRSWTIEMVVGVISVSNKASNIYNVLPVRGTTAGPAPVPATGQTVHYPGTTAAPGQDGDLQKGIPLPTTRFQVNGDGTATDALTGLVWLQDANCIKTHYPTIDAAGTGQVIWQTALDFIAGMNTPGTYPLCDGGHHGWRLPNRNELRSLVNYESNSSNYYSSLISNYGFSNIQSNLYWSSTSAANDPVHAAWTLNTWGDEIGTAGKNVIRFVWPVRSAPKIQVTPSPSFDYGFVYVDDTKIHTFTITNGGSADLVIGSLDIPFMTGAEYLILNDYCLNATLAPGESCTVDIAIQPQASGWNDTSQLEIASNAGSVSIGLTWTGETCMNSSVATYNPPDIQTGAFNDIQSAYNNSGTTDNTIVKVRMIYFSGDLNFPQPSQPGKIITLKGGYDCAFFASTYYSTIIGKLTITSGKATIENIVIH